MTAAWPQAACGCLAKALVAALVITGLSIAGLSAPPAAVASPAGGVSSSGGASAGTSKAAAGEQSTNATSTSGDNGSLTMWCTTSNSYVNPGLLDLLATQYQSGPVETVTCVPAAVGPDGSITVLSECAVTNTYMSPGALDLLASQAQSGPAQTMTCVPTTGGADGDNGVAVLSACTVSNGYTNPGVLGLLAPQFQSGPVQTVTCIPAVVAENATGSPRGKAAGSSGDSSGTARDTTSAGGSRGNAADPSAAAQGLAGIVTEQSVLAATGPAGSIFVGRGLSELLIGLGVLGLRIARATTRGPGLRETDAPGDRKGARNGPRTPASETSSAAASIPERGAAHRRYSGRPIALFMLVE